MLGPQRWRVVVVLVVGAVACSERPSRSRVAESDGQPTAALLLEELTAVALPDSFIVAGVSGTDSGIVLWAANQSFVLVHSGQPLYSVPTSAPPIHAALNEDGSLSVVSTTTVEHISQNGRREVIVTLGGSGLVVDALHGPNGWLVGRIERDRSYRIVRIAINGAAKVHHRLSASDLHLVKGETSFVAPVSMRRATKGVVLSLTKPPHTNILLDDDGQLMLAFEPPKRVMSTLPGERPARWAALPALQLDCGYIQVISDLNSDRRRVIVYDLKGRMLRETEVDAPIGFVYANPQTKRLLAVRSTQGAELVTYEWQWVQDRTPRGGNSCSQTG